jgi:hypothetical protein
MTSAESRRVRRVSDAVLASYIHEISTRTRSGATPPDEREDLVQRRVEGRAGERAG